MVVICSSDKKMGAIGNNKIPNKSSSSSSDPAKRYLTIWVCVVCRRQKEKVFTPVLARQVPIQPIPSNLYIIKGGIVVCATAERGIRKKSTQNY
jgi:hypothetical protein